MKAHALMHLALITTLLIVAAAFGQPSQWTSNTGGFYENSGAWTPNGVPTGHAFFGLPNEYEIGLLGDHSIDALSIVNGTDVTFAAGGSDPEDRNYSVLRTNVINANFASTAGVNLRTEDLIVRRATLTADTGSVDCRNGRI